MADSYTDSNRFTLIEPGTRENTWGTGLNQEVISLMDKSLDGYTSVSVSGTGNTTLTTNNGAADQARSRVLRIKGSAQSGCTIIIPDEPKLYFVEVGHTGSDVTIRNVSDSNGVSIATGGENLAIYCDGTSTKSLIAPPSPDPFSSSDITTQTSAVIETSASMIYSKNDSLFKDSFNSIKIEILKSVYPVGALYCNYSNSDNPNTTLGFGTWVAVEGKVLVGLDSGDADFDTAGETGGAKTHTLTISEMPSHSHTITNKLNSASAGPFVGGENNSTTHPSIPTISTNTTGSGQAHNNLQPYVVVYMWRRTA